MAEATGLTNSFLVPAGVMRGIPLVVSAPSGAGKTTICRQLVKQLSFLEFSVSYTTRKPRPGEVPGVDYHFIDEATFSKMIANEEFLEWAAVYDHRYGTAKKNVEHWLQQGVDVLFDIDMQGGRQLAAKLPTAVLVFIVPPDLETLKARLLKRGKDSQEEIAKRLSLARQEMSMAHFYHYVIVNNDLDNAVADLSAVLRVARLNRQKLAGVVSR